MECNLTNIYVIWSTGRRAMVNKLWFRELSRKWVAAREPTEAPAPRRFTEAGCGAHSGKLHSWYLIYRWLNFATWLGVLVSSVLEWGSAEPVGKPEKWPIYLTNWDLSLGCTQALLGALLVTERWTRRSSSSAEVGCTRLIKVYWFLNIATTSLALGVTSSYWCLVHDPSKHHLDAQNFLVHVLNSVLVLLDFILGNVPFELRCFWWAPLVVVCYILFSLVYYFAGGLNKHGHHMLYNILDWKQPLQTIAYCIGGLFYLAFNHCLLCCLSRFRDRFYLDKFDAVIKDANFRAKTESSV